jgi:hypothetical protein
LKLGSNLGEAAGIGNPSKEKLDATVAFGLGQKDTRSRHECDFLCQVSTIGLSHRFGGEEYIEELGKE